jgi:orotate phosphoribosyltransferase
MMPKSHLHTPEHLFIENALALGAIDLLPEGCKLKSGRWSYYFFNTSKFEKGQGQSLLAEAYALALYRGQHTNQIQAIYGPPYKGIELADIVSAKLWKRFGIIVDIASSRKEEKTHGEGVVHLGSNLKGKSGKGTCLIDDVMTTGGSLEEAYKYVKECGGFPTVCAIAFDRMERGKVGEFSATQIFQKCYEIPVCSIANVRHLVEVLEAHGDKYTNGKVTLPKIQRYLEEFGVTS